MTRKHLPFEICDELTNNVDDVPFG